MSSDEQDSFACFLERTAPGVFDRVVTKTVSDDRDGVLYYGDNLKVLRNREWFPSASADLIYLDPPFNSKQTYNMFFDNAAAQTKAFEDTWTWDDIAQAAHDELLGKSDVEVPDDVITLFESFDAMLRDDERPMLAYLSVLGIRLVEMHRVLKPNGSMFLHCDPAASHYLKVILDRIFGKGCFRNELIWQRSLAKGLATRKLPSNHDTILWYSKGTKYFYDATATTIAYDHDDLPEKTKEKYSLVDEQGRRYQLTSLLNPNKDRRNLQYEFLGVTRVWRWERERMLQAYRDGLVVQPPPGRDGRLKVPREKRYLDEQVGRALGDVWTDIWALQGTAEEYLGYPTQKPMALLARIIKMACPPDGIVLDPFCGCGTTIAAAQANKREWRGIDITYAAIGLIRRRLQDHFPSVAYKVEGEPEDWESAEDMARKDPFQFQWWVLSRIGARPVSGEKKKGADKGIDGVLRYRDDPEATTSRRAMVSVKGGERIGSKDIRELLGVLDREKEVIGIFVTLHEPTSKMRQEAAEAGTWKSPTFGKTYRRIQIITVRELLAGVMPHYPGHAETYVEAPTVVADADQLGLFDGHDKRERVRRPRRPQARPVEITPPSVGLPRVFTAVVHPRDRGLPTGAADDVGTYDLPARRMSRTKAAGKAKPVTRARRKKSAPKSVSRSKRAHRSSAARRR